MKLQILVIGMAVATAVFMNGCADKKIGPPINTGFFEDYKKTVTEIKATPNLAAYTKIKVSPVKVVSGIVENQESASQKKCIKRFLNI